jgi:PST family polysaccharide transporter
MLSGSGVQAVLRIASVVTLARLLTAEEFGVMGAALVVTGLSTLFSQLGMGPALVQRPDLEDRHVRTAFAVSMVLSIVLAGGVLLSAPAISALFRFESLESVLRAVALLFPINGLSVVAISLLKRNLKFSVIAIVNAASYAVGYVAVGISLAVLGFGVWALVYAHVARASIATIAILILQPHSKRPEFEYRAFSELMKFGGGFTISRLFNYSANQGDYVVAGRWLGEAALGIYTRAYQLLVFPVNLFASVLDDVLFPSMALVQGDISRLWAAFRRGAATIALVFLPLSVFATILAPEIVMIALGSEWMEVVAPFRILAVGMFFRAGYKVSNSVSRAVGAVYRQAWRQGVFAAAVFAGSWFGQRYGELNGLALGVLGALIVNFIMMNRLSLALVGETWRSFLTAHLGGLRAAVLTLVIVLATVSPLRRFDVPDLVVLLAASLTMTLGAVTAGRLRPAILGPDGIWIVGTIRRVVRKKTSRSGKAIEGS